MTMLSKDQIIPTIEKILEQAGTKNYGSERVNQLEHALQCAALAEQNHDATALVVASLLHDIGHLLEFAGRDFDVLAQKSDHQHEMSGASYLERYFNPDVTEPVRLHVAAKRYLCYADPLYWDSLSVVSKKTLELQGGVFGAEEAANFINQPHAAQAVQLRTYDDLAKVPGKPTPTLSHYLQLTADCLK